jgi:hypothetical protein
MKHIPTIIDYSLLLDYAVSSGSATPILPGKERSDVEGFCKVKDGYYWVRYRAENKPLYYYKTPFRKTEKLINIKEQHIKSLIEMWINQYLKFSEKVMGYIQKHLKRVSTFIVDYYLVDYYLDGNVQIKIPLNATIDEPTGYNYGTCLLLYTLLTTPARCVATETMVNYRSYTWSDINEGNSVITVRSVSPDTVVNPVLSLLAYGTCAIYEFDREKQYQVQIGSGEQISYDGEGYAGLVVGFIIDPSVINMIFIEQLVNNSFVYAVNVNGQGRNPGLWGCVKVKRILSQSLGSAIIPYYFPVNRRTDPNAIDSDTWLHDNVVVKIVGTINPDKGIEGGLVPNYFDERYWDDEIFYHEIYKYVPVLVKNIVRVDQGTLQSFKQALVGRLQAMTQDYKITTYDVPSNSVQVKSSQSQTALYLYNPLDFDLTSEMLRVFGMKNIVPEGSVYDCYQSFDVTRFPKIPFLDNIARYWIDYADYSLTEP